MLVFKKMPFRITDDEMQLLTNICFDPEITWFSPKDVIYEKYVNYSDDTIYFLKDSRLKFKFFASVLLQDLDLSNALLSKTPKGNMQPPHKDKSRDYSLYIPIYPDMYDYSPMTFYYDNELHHIDNLDPGAVYLVNHKVMHSAFNFTDYDRFNLQITLKEEDALRFI